MNLREFRQTSGRSFVNTINDWGYNGYIGIMYSKGKYQYLDAMFHHRFEEPSKYEKYYIGGEEVSRRVFIESIKVANLK